MTNKTESIWTPEYKREYAREWSRKNKEKVAASNKRWRDENPDYMKEYMKGYKDSPDNRIRMAEYQKEWYKANPEYHKEWNKEHPDYHKERLEGMERQKIADRQKKIEKIGDIMIG